MVRRNSSPLSGLSDAEFKRMAGQLRGALKDITGAGPHAPFTGTHNHSHSAFGHGSGDDNGAHSHPHSHDNDADHGSHGDAHAFIWPAAPNPNDRAPGRKGRRTEDLRPPEQRDQPPKHVRFSPGVTTIAAGQPGRVYNAARLDAAWDRLTATVAENERRHGR